MNRKHAAFIMHLVNSAFAGIGIGVVLLIVTDSCRQDPNLLPPRQPFHESDPHYDPKTNPILTIPSGDLYTVPSYPSCLPPASGLARIAGGTNLNAGLSRVRDRSPPVGVSV